MGFIDGNGVITDVPQSMHEAGKNGGGRRVGITSGKVLMGRVSAARVWA